MRVLVLAGEWFPDWKGGNARAVTSASRALAEQGHEVTVLAPSRMNGPCVTTEGSLTVRHEIRRGRLPVTFSDFIAGLRQGPRLRSEQFDVIFGDALTRICGVLRRGIDTPLVLLYHAPTPQELRFERSHLPLPKRLAAYAIEPPIVLFEREAIRRAARVLVLSDFSRSLLTADHPDAAARVRKVSGGVDVCSFSPADGVARARERLGIAPDGPLLLTVRRLEPRMGLDNLIAAVAHLSRTSDVNLVVGGEGSLKGELRKLTAELGVENRVRFVGHVSEAELRDWYRAADLFVLPTIAYEGFGLVTAEALASGTPVVGTPVGATPELLAPLDPRLVTRGTDPAALAEAITDVLGFAGEDLRRRCRDYASRHFAWRNVIVDWDSALREVADGSRSTPVNGSESRRVPARGGEVSSGSSSGQEIF